MPSLEERIAVLETREACKALGARYAWRAARADHGAICDLFTPDGVFEAPPGGPSDEPRRRAI